MKNVEHVSFYGQPVDEKIVTQIFEEIREALQHEYPVVKNIRKPPIKAYSVPTQTYLQTAAQLLNSRNISHPGEKQPGSENEASQSSALIFRSTKDDVETWVLIKREGFGYPLEYDLRHEMTHIFESIMLIPQGSLAEKIEPETGNRLDDLIE